ncbi:hypothetical protein KIW84_032544 [Lathyrus oleraceus]|uniref:Uncharacterized protein n=1 Tax=Pisum sativum TaxID=3888 RepID=A0A9D5B1U5_PEA|nr:hypothetical protein KIW84_032544 [Pisum sativum]
MSTTAHFIDNTWNSTYLMLDDAEKFEATFEKLEDEDPGYMKFFHLSSPPCTIDWEKYKVEVILDKEKYNLEELLLFFLRDKEHVEQLFHYIIEEPPMDAENKQVFKFEQLLRYIIEEPPIDVGNKRVFKYAVLTNNLFQNSICFNVLTF